MEISSNVQLLIISLSDIALISLFIEQFKLRKHHSFQSCNRLHDPIVHMYANYCKRACDTRTCNNMDDIRENIEENAPRGQLGFS